MPKLVIVESPAKAKTIGKYLGRGYKVTASMGHVRDLPASQLGIDIEHGYTPKYITIKGKQKLVKELKAEAKKCDGVLLATDPDREGEAISWHLKELLDLPDGKASGLKEAMRVLRDVEGIGICELTNADVVRHVMVQRIVEAYERYETAKNGGKGRK